MERDRSALPLVRDLDLEPEQDTELALEKLEVGVGGLGRVARARPADVGAGTRTSPLAPGTCFGLPHRKSFGDDFASELLRVFGRRDRPCVTHGDIACQ